jgi:hypothetical protein
LEDGRVVLLDSLLSATLGELAAEGVFLEPAVLKGVVQLARRGGGAIEVGDLGALLLEVQEQLRFYRILVPVDTIREVLLAYGRVLLRADVVRVLRD